MGEKEIWKIIEGFTNYLVSNQGNVKSIGREYTKRNGRRGVVKEIIKKQCKTRGHFVTRLTNDIGESHCLYVHRLIAIAFIPNPENKPCINHIDGIKANNSISNLEWCTWSENNQHAIDNGLRGYNIGCANVWSVFSRNDIINIRQLYKDGHKITPLMKMYNRSRSAIENVVKGISYKDIVA